MKGRSFSLVPFPSARPLPAVKISGTVERRDEVLYLGYDLLGPTGAISIPAPSAEPVRRDGLWKETCFEMFLGPLKADRYWEFNFSPAGHWNVYRFEAYREGMHEEQAFTALPFFVKSRQGALNLSVELDLAKIIPQGQALKVGISAVLISAEGDCTYWALTHPGPQPDFHRRDGFLIEC